MGRLDGKVAIITGAAMGQGEAEAKLFASEGAKVVVTDIAVEEGQAVVEAIKAAGGDAIFIKHDVANEEEWKNVIKTTVDTYGKLNILVNNAGILDLAGLEETSNELWDRTMDVNLKGPFYGCKYAVPEMRKVGGGSVINISSIYGLIGSGGSTAYQSSKGALRIMTKTLAVQYATENIRFNSIHPGTIETPMTAPGLADPEIRASWMKVIPMARPGKPNDIAYCALWLASDESTFCTGAEIQIDGGTVAG
jgi:cyclopentanol dehydrogenase